MTRIQITAMHYDVVNPDGRRVASLVHGEDTAALVAALGEGYRVVRHDARTLDADPIVGINPVLWHEGHEEISAAESFDAAAEMMAIRAKRLFDEEE